MSIQHVYCRSSTDLYEDHKRALIEGRSVFQGRVITMDPDEDKVAFQRAMNAQQPRVSHWLDFTLVSHCEIQRTASTAEHKHHQLRAYQPSAHQSTGVVPLLMVTTVLSTDEINHCSLGYIKSVC